MPDRLGQNPRIQTVPLLKGLVQCLPTNMFGSTLLIQSRALLIELVLISRRIQNPCSLREGFKKKIVEYSTKGLTPPPPPLVEKILLAKNDLHTMKRILYDTGPVVVARWPLKRVFKRRHSFLVKRPPP